MMDFEPTQPGGGTASEVASPESQHNVAENRSTDANDSKDREPSEIATASGGQSPDGSSIAEKNPPGATFPKQFGNAWGITANEPANPGPDRNANNTKKRSNLKFLAGDSPSGNNEESGNTASSKPKFTDIMAEQESQKKSYQTAPAGSRTKVSFSHGFESEDERMMRLAIEASLKDQRHNTTDGFQSHATKMPPSALKNSQRCDSGKSNYVSFSNQNFVHGEDDEMDDEMRMAIALSLQEAGSGKSGDAFAASVGVAAASLHDGDKSMDYNMKEVEDDRKPSALPPKVAPCDFMDDELKPEAIEIGSGAAQGSEGERSINELVPDCYTASASAPASCTNPSFARASAAVATAPAAAASIPPMDDSEKLAQALHEAELADAAAEAASLKLAMKLQQEEDARHLKGDKTPHDDYGGIVGVRTVGREEFDSLKSDREYGDGRMADRRRQEEMGVGKLLSCKSFYGDDFPRGYNETDDYYYYANDRFHGSDIQEDNELDEDGQDDGIRMNSQTASSKWQRLDKDTFIGPNNEIRTKHDPELKARSNAMNLLGSHGAKLKDAYNHNGSSSDNMKSASVSDRAYNAFRRAESRQSGFKKGVAKQGHGRAENMNAGKTRGGGMDDNVRLQISAAINAGLIDNCNGVVKEGKEALVYHADGGRTDRGSIATSLDETPEAVGSDGYDVAVKVFKRIAEFKGRGSYVDGDPRYFDQKFKANDQREQMVLWAFKEYRNLIRAHRAGVAVPKPLRQKENIVFMRFLGDQGWPSPQLKEIDIKKGSKKWTTFYGQTMVAIRRLYHCARLIHADLSEYNILVCPSWQTSKDHFDDKRTDDDETLQIVLIDFGMAVEVRHPSASAWLRRDLTAVRDFFVRQGIKTLSNEEADKFVTDPFEGVDNDALLLSDKEMAEMNESQGSVNKTGTNDDSWRHSKRGWDATKNMNVLLNMLKMSSDK